MGVQVSAPPDMRDSTRAILEAHIKEAGNHSLFLLAVDASEAPNVSKVDRRTFSMCD
jgi:hypothetical protein